MPDKSFDAAQTAYHEAASQFSRAILAWVGRTVLGQFPTAVEMVVRGDMEGSEFGFRLRGVRLLDVDAHMVRDVEGAPCDVDAYNASKNFQSLLDDEIDAQLDWLGALEGEDNWIGEDTIDLMPLATHDPSFRAVRVRFADQGNGFGIFYIVLVGAGRPEFVIDTRTVGEGDDYNLAQRRTMGYAGAVAQTIGCHVEIDETAGPR